MLLKCLGGALSAWRLMAPSGFSPPPTRLLRALVRRPRASCNERSGELGYLRGYTHKVGAPPFTPEYYCLIGLMGIAFLGACLGRTLS